VAPGFALDVDIPFALLHDPVHRREAETRAANAIFGRKERLEQVRLGRGVDPHAGIRHHHLDVIAFLLLRRRASARLTRTLRVRSTRRPPSGMAIAACDGEVQQDSPSCPGSAFT